MIIKSLPKLAEPEFKLHQGSEIIGDTLFINGVPHKFCGKCRIPVKLSDGIRSNVSGRKVELKPYKITIIGGWVEIGEEIITVNGFPTVKKHHRPIIMQKLGCFDCWNLQQRRKLNSNDKEWMFDIKDCFKGDKK